MDGYSSLLKPKYRRSDVYSTDQLEQVVSSSTFWSVAQLVTQPGLTWFAWDVFFAPYFKTIPGILKLLKLNFDVQQPGVVTVKESSTSAERQVCILRGMWKTYARPV